MLGFYNHSIKKILLVEQSSKPSVTWEGMAEDESWRQHSETPVSKSKTSRAVMAHAFNPSAWEAEAGGFLSSRSAWSPEWVPGQPGLYRETLSQWLTRASKMAQQVSVPPSLAASVWLWDSNGRDRNNSHKLPSDLHACILVHALVQKHKVYGFF